MEIARILFTSKYNVPFLKLPSSVIYRYRYYSSQYKHSRLLRDRTLKKIKYQTRRDIREPMHCYKWNVASTYTAATLINKRYFRRVPSFIAFFLFLRSRCVSFSLLYNTRRIFPPLGFILTLSAKLQGRLFAAHFLSNQENF